MWNLLSSFARGYLKLRWYPVTLLSNQSFYTVIYVPKLQTEHIILSCTLDCILGGVIYRWLIWILYTSGNMWVFFFFFLWILPGLDFRQSYVPFSLTFGQVPAPHVVLRDPGMPVTWTGRGLARVLTGAGLRFAVNNIPFPMDFTMAIRYEAQVPFKSNGDEKLKCILEPSFHSSLTR